MPVDSLLILFRTQLVHSKITRTRTSLPLAMNLLWVFYSLDSSIFIFRSEAKRRRKEQKKIEVANPKSNSERFRCNR